MNASEIEDIFEQIKDLEDLGTIIGCLKKYFRSIEDKGEDEEEPVRENEEEDIASNIQKDI